jgi:hypothetical protein
MQEQLIARGACTDNHHCYFSADITFFAGPLDVQLKSFYGGIQYLVGFATGHARNFKVCVAFDKAVIVSYVQLF